MKFLDLAKIFINSGNGGSGCISFRKEKFVEFGGPDGGDGGNGGDVWVEGCDSLNTLIDFKFQQHYKAKNGLPGMGKNRTGKNGSDVVIKVPVGTQVLDEEKKNIITEIITNKQRFRILHGGNGGWGNSRFKSSTNQAPRLANKGQDGKENVIWLHLKIIADVGILGLPNAGKSTFLSQSTNANPKVDKYPFTTLFPNLGVIKNLSEQIIIADIPGLIKDAHLGKGLGTRFLGHIERCSLLLHFIDITSKDIINDYKVIRNEIKKYGKNLHKKKILTVLNKKDLLDYKEQIKQIDYLKKYEKKIYNVSSLNNHGIEDLFKDIENFVNQMKNKKDGKLNLKTQKWEPN